MTSKSSTTTPASVRAALIDALHIDLVGPRSDHPAHAAHAAEVLPTAPSKWYLTGFLAPHGASVAARSDDTANDELDQADGAGAGDDDAVPERAPARKPPFPSSMGLSVLLPEAVAELEVTVCWGDYEALPDARHDLPRREDLAGSVWGQWQRTPRQVTLAAPVHESDTPVEIEVPDSGGLHLAVSVRPVRAGGLDGVRSVSVFLVNGRPPAADVRRDAAYVFQAELVLRSARPFFARPNLRGQNSREPDEQVADLQYHDAYEYAVGHNVSAVAVRDANGACHEVRTAWIPVAEVEKVEHAEVAGVDLRMESLAAATDAAAVHALVAPMLDAYAQWIEDQAAYGAALAEPGRRQVAAELAQRAHVARARMQSGLDALAEPHVLEAFRVANRAVATALRQRKSREHAGMAPEQVSAPSWRPFQIAFLLMNLAGLAHGEHPDRKVVDLLFFPTGGGKTEAYLGLAAFTMVLRRLRDPSIHGAGVSVLMRYTLRLLTLDQLERAATLVCALELERQQDVHELGTWPFEIGLWVGQSATPNRMGRKGDKDQNTARARTIAFQNDPKRKPSPIPLESCPWCGDKFTKDSFQLLPDTDAPRELRVFCASRRCAFHPRRQQRGLPILAVDEPIYRRLPAFLIATVDKFANLPWVGDTAGLFGRVSRHDDDGFYALGEPRTGKALERRLLPPDLVIQDELHLISGPLGTMVGLYESAIDALSARDRGTDHEVRPKIVASTATVRRADRQIRALFGRANVDVFPPPGPDRRNSFFARTVPSSERNARLYVGVAAQGRNLKVILLRTYLTLLAAAQKHWLAAGGSRQADNPADPYMTLLGYFNSLRELGGSRRIVEDEVRARLLDYGQRRRRVGEAESPFANRAELAEPEELTSRVSTNLVAETKRRLALGFHDKERIDVVLATNMISVGLDITRLGLMVVLGQPKTAAEYIQATSRVGRDEERPGLVVTLLNLHRPRDRSHYERFATWHESFYRAVEATSVTPFSPRAVDRGIAAVTVALSRLGFPQLTPPRGAAAIGAHRKALDEVADILASRAEGHDNLDADEAEGLRQRVRARVMDLLDTWQHVADQKGELQYQREVGGAPPLLFEPLDPELLRQPREAQKFKAHRSLRDVEPTVNLWVRGPHEGGPEGQP
jgi:hypothetical protein